MSRNQYLDQYRHSRRKKRQFMKMLPYIILAGILIVLLFIAGILYMKKKPGSQNTSSDAVVTSEEDENNSGDNPESSQPDSEEEVSTDLTNSDEFTSLLNSADLLAAGYDYDKAIELLSASAYADREETAAAIAEYEQIKTTLVKASSSKITHVFFHSLIIDASKAFDDQPTTKGYNQVMTTKEEFDKILESMYEKGFVLVQLRDVAYETTGEDGKPKFTDGEIMLPPGKQPFVMSQDDVCYYEYMKGDGFATKIVVGEDGKPTCEMPLEDDTVVTGSFDLVPILNDFIREHPDFSYQGAKAVLAFTGYNGILGYRTAASYNTEEYLAENPGFDYEKERAEATKVAEALKADGWELASHSWGHRDMGTISMENFIADTDKWENEVETLIGPCDTILFPFGSDIGSWMPYEQDNERFKYLYNKGFRYFCNVDSNQYWVQIGENFMRQGRRNLDGFRMYYDLPETNPTKDHLSDLFDVTEVFDRRRPTPVAPMSE